MGGSFVSGAILATGLATALVSACAGSALPPADPPFTPPPLVTPPSPSPPPSTVGETTPAPAPPAAADPDPPLDDPNESASPIPLVLQFDRTKGRSSFPKRTKPDSECWAGLPATGDHATDYAAITLACGAPTGLVEYAKPVEGTLHHKHDQADVFTMPVLAGYCYRYFAIADSSIADLDLLIEKKGGILVGDDKTNGPFAIVDTEEAWCQDEDQSLEFHVQVDGPGKGGYTFGVWARPKR
jgi:hypothetical protein